MLSPFPADSDAFGRPEQAWMLNLRVRDLDAMVAQHRRSRGRPAPAVGAHPDALQEPPDR